MAADPISKNNLIVILWITKQKPLRVEAEAEARKQMEQQGIVFSDQETGKVGDKSETEFMAGLIMDDIQAAQQDQRKEDEYLKAVEAADRDEADVDLAEYKKEEDKSGDGASGGGGQEGGGDAAPSAKGNRKSY